MKSSIIISCLLCAFLLISCNKQFSEEESEAASAKMNPVSDKKFEGKISIIQPADDVLINVDFKGLEPNKRFGFHIHEFGDCSGENAQAAGGHFNPMKTAHGSLANHMSHAGDLGNIQSDSNGEIHTQIKTDKVSLKKSSEVFIIGRAFVLHNSTDDFTTQPSGSAGDRIGCAVIVKESQLAE